MRIVLCLALLIMMGALLLSTSTRPVGGCTDWDEDGVCAASDCNDFNPTVGYNDDADADGVTVCQGDCDDGDAANIDRCGGVHRMYPVFYEPPEQPCREGYTLTTKVYRCWYDAFGVLQCETEPYYQYDSPWLRDCFPIG